MTVRMLFLLFIALCSPAFGQGFAGLGTDAEGFAVPRPDPDFDFPADHGPHPQYRIEWWYLTANLTGADGTEYGAQWTLFRSALRPEVASALRPEVASALRPEVASALRPEDGSGWDAPQLWMGHTGLTTATQHYSAERLGRGGIGQAGVDAVPFRAYIDDWQMRSTAPPEADAFDALRVTARGADFAYDLALEAKGPLVRHGDAGYSVKSAAGQASYYYSQPFFEVTGTITLPSDGSAPAPVAVTGQAWLDREWSSQPLAADQTGWDWFSLHFDSGAKLMGFGLRSDIGAHFTSASWIAPDGTTTAYGDGALSLEPLREADVAGRSIPVAWRLSLPEQGLQIETTPLNPQSWMDTQVSYWEGPILVTGSHTGRGYLEMTGYE